MNETVPTLFAIALGGALGAMLRFRLRFVTQNVKISMGTYPGNIIASFLLGLVSALFSDEFFAVEGWQIWFHPFLTVGIAGSLSTFSSLMLEMHETTKKHGWLKSIGYALFTFVTGLIALSIGIFLGTSVPV
jgi:CrcB protein